MRFVDLFAGIGGFSLGLKRAGMQCVGQVEIDPFCQKVLAKNWPDVKRIADIREVRGDEFGPVNLVCGGPPCQPASLAGKRRGAEDDRWLWPEAFRVVGAIRPAWCLFENPPGILTLDFDGVLAALESLGYSARPLVIPACAVDSPHGRSRVWIVAHAESQQMGTAGQPRQCEDVGDSSSTACELDSREIPPEEARFRGAGKQHGDCTIRPPDAGEASRFWTDSEWLQCREPDGAITCRRVKPGLQLLVDGFPGRLAEIQGFGNAVVPELVEEIGRAILAADGG